MRILIALLAFVTVSGHALACNADGDNGIQLIHESDFNQREANASNAGFTAERAGWASGGDL